MSRLSDAAKKAAKWFLGAVMWGLGVYVLVAKIAVWPGIGLVTFGVFILYPSELQAFAVWFKQNAAGFLASGAPKDG